MERDPDYITGHEPPTDRGRFSIMLDTERYEVGGVWEDGHWPGALVCAVLALLGIAAKNDAWFAAFFAAAVICACMPRWRRL